jgi:hypothetical protein
VEPNNPKPDDIFSLVTNEFSFATKQSSSVFRVMAAVIAPPSMTVDSILNQLDLNDGDVDTFTLCMLASKGDAEQLKAFLNEHPKLNPNSGDPDGRTALHLAAEAGSYAMTFDQL